MVGFLRLCQHFAKKKREMECQASNMTRPQGQGNKAQVAVVRTSSEKSRKRPPKIDQSVQCSGDVQQPCVQQSVQQSVHLSVQQSVQATRVDVSEEEERELEKRLLKLQELLEESNEDSDREDNFDAEIESALKGVDKEIAKRSEGTDLVVVSSKTAAVLSVDVALPEEPSDSEPFFYGGNNLKCKHCEQRVNQLIISGRPGTEQCGCKIRNCVKVLKWLELGKCFKSYKISYLDF